MKDSSSYLKNTYQSKSLNTSILYSNPNKKQDFNNNTNTVVSQFELNKPNKENCKIENINSLVRIKPYEDSNYDNKLNFIVNNNKLTVQNPYTNEFKTFTYNYVADENSSQYTVYNQSAKNLLQYFISGYNCTLFTYGITGAGKTFTLFGSNQNQGLLELTLSDLFKMIQVLGYNVNTSNNNNENINNYNINSNINSNFNSSSKNENYDYSNRNYNDQNLNSLGQMSFSLSCSLIEIYNEKIYDISNNNKTELFLREINNTIVLEDQVKIPINNTLEARNFIKNGLKNRHLVISKDSHYNKSHIICTFYLNLDKENGIKSSKSLFHFVDLAGSERYNKTDLNLIINKENGCVNKSLLNLTHVIKQLIEQAEGKTNYVSYRDSKLTHLLRDSLGGNSKTFFIANINPDKRIFNETFSSLMIAQNATLIKNSISNNIYRKVSHEDENCILKEENSILKQHITKLKLEITNLRECSTTNNRKNDNNMNYKNNINQDNVNNDSVKNQKYKDMLISEEYKTVNSELVLSLINKNKTKERKIQLLEKEIEEMVSTSRYLTVNNANVSNENEKLKFEINRLNEHLRSNPLSEMNLELKCIEINKLKEKVSSLYSEISDLKLENLKLNEININAGNEIEKLSSANNKIKEDNEDLLKQMHYLNQIHLKHESLFNKQKDQLNELRAKDTYLIDMYKMQIHNSQQRLKTLEERNNKDHVFIIKSKVIINDYEIERKILTEKIKSLHSSLAELLRDLENSNERILELILKNDKLVNESNDLRKKYDYLTINLNNKKTNIDYYKKNKEELICLKKENEELLKNNEILEKFIKQMRNFSNNSNNYCSNSSCYSSFSGVNVVGGNAINTGSFIHSDSKIGLSNKNYSGFKTSKKARRSVSFDHIRTSKSKNKLKCKTEKLIRVKDEIKEETSNNNDKDNNMSNIKRDENGDNMENNKFPFINEKLYQNINDIININTKENSNKKFYISNDNDKSSNINSNTSNNIYLDKTVNSYFSNTKSNKKLSKLTNNSKSKTNNLSPQKQNITIPAVPTLPQNLIGQAYINTSNFKSLDIIKENEIIKSENQALKSGIIKAIDLIKRNLEIDECQFMNDNSNVLEHFKIIEKLNYFIGKIHRLIGHKQLKIDKLKEEIDFYSKNSYFKNRLQSLNYDNLKISLFKVTDFSICDGKFIKAENEGIRESENRRYSNGKGTEFNIRKNDINNNIQSSSNDINDIENSIFCNDSNHDIEEISEFSKEINELNELNEFNGINGFNDISSSNIFDESNKSILNKIGVKRSLPNKINNIAEVDIDIYEENRVSNKKSK